MNRLPFMKTGACSALALSATFVVACSNPPPQVDAFVFNRPEHVEFACIDPEGSSDSEETPLVLPMECCAPVSPFNPTEYFDSRADRADSCGTGTPAPHALVTQSTRGEVAAVDLIARKVLDSDQRVPGYTFVDVGGLPRAIVTPRHRPGNAQLGPPWTYVASGEEQSLRAVATCHFREGAECGPEAGLDAEDLKLALPATPRDMVFAADALWITLPDLSAIARIGLPTGATDDKPFASTKDDIRYFRLPVATATEPAAPVREDPEYVTACGLGYEVVTQPDEMPPELPPGEVPLTILMATEVVAPTSDNAQGAGVASPTRLRFYSDDPDDKSAEGDGLLLVADATQPLIHALSIEAEGLQVRGTIATGAPIRDFALTPRPVPKLAPALRFVGDGVKKGPAFGPDENRYLYAIDDRDGSVMVHSVDYAGGAVSTVPLLVPSTRVRSDRLPLGSPATAIDIADNRNLTRDENNADFVCDWGLNAGETSDNAINGAEDKVDDAEEKLEELSELIAAERDPTKKAALELERDTAQLALDKALKLKAQLDILKYAGTQQLRGVFAMITTLLGDLAVVDVHDLDLFCRSEKNCENSSDLTDLGNEDAEPLAVRRHALRISGFAEPELTVTNASSLDQVSCELGRYEAAKRGEDSTGGTEPDTGPADGTEPDTGPADGTDPDAGPDAGDASRDAGTDAGDAPLDAGTGEMPGSESDAGVPARTKDDVLACTASDPWLVTNPNWVANWEASFFAFEGRLAECGGEGRPTCDGAADLVLLAPVGVDFCARGVVDSRSGAEGATYKGDQAVFTGDSPNYPSGCAVPDDDNEKKFTIQAAFSDRLELKARAAEEVDELLRCYPDFVRYQLRANQRFLVTANTGAPPLHRIVADADGRCVADAERDPRLVSRAEPGVEFSNIFSTFQASKVDDSDPEAVAATASRGNSPFVRRVDLSGPESLPVSVRYLDLTGDLYVVDVAQGLRRFVLAPEFELDTESYR